MRKMFLDELPHKGKLINWKQSLDYIIRFIHDDIEGEFKILNYDNSNQKRELTIEYNNKIFYIPTSNFKQGRISNILGRYTSDFKIKIRTRFQDDKRDITITDREYRKRKDNYGNEKWYKYHCNICKWDEGWIEESNLVNNKRTGCSCCTNRTPVLGINTICDTDKWMIPYIGEECAKTHTHGSTNKVNPTCPDCGQIKFKKLSINTIYTCHSIGCKCSDGISYPNKFSYELLNQLDKIYKFDYLEHEYSPDWIKPKRYDNYFLYLGKEYILEMDGYFHNNDNDMNGQTIEESRLIDDCKERLAKEHGIEVIRIDCDPSEFTYIKQNVLNNKEINKLFDLSKINWNKCDEFALSNRVKVACEFKRNNPNMTTTDIGNIMKISNTTIVTYLKKGNKIGWCTYDSKESKQQFYQKLREQKGVVRHFKTVEVIKDNIILGVFKNVSELSRQSEKLFGIKLKSANISLVCTGKRKQYKGYIFKYI